MKYESNDRLREYLDRAAAGAYREHLRHPRFEFNEERAEKSHDDWAWEVLNCNGARESLLGPLA